MPSELIRSRSQSASPSAEDDRTPAAPPTAPAPPAAAAPPGAPAAPGPSTQPSRRLVVLAAGALSGALLAAVLALGQPVGTGNGLVVVLGLTLALALATAAPIILGTARSVRTARREQEDAQDVAAHHRAGTGTNPLASAASTGTRMLGDRADLIAACDAALANRDVVGGDVALLVLDLVGLDAVQEGLGPSGLDDVARQTLRRLRAWLPPQDSVAQLGATTFAVLLEGLGQEGPGPQTARLTALLGEPMTSAGRYAEVEFAVGVAPAEVEDDGTRLLLEALRATAADAARRGAPVELAPAGPPSRGRTGQGLLDVELTRTAQELRTALRGGGLQAAFRPIVRLDDPERIIAIQALPRWSGPGGLDLTAGQLDALAAHVDMTAELDRQLLERGLDAVASWYAAGFAVGRLAVRFGQDHLVDAALPGQVASHLARRQLPGTCLVAEVDAAAVSDAAAAAAVLEALRGQGIEVVLTGVVAPHAALGLLHLLPLSGISLHRALVARLVGGSSAAIATLTEARHEGLRVIAEDVATAAQLGTLRACGVDAAWGTAVAGPARARDISTRLSAARSLVPRG